MSEHVTLNEMIAWVKKKKLSEKIHHLKINGEKTELIELRKHIVLSTPLMFGKRLKK
jgi:hypothetical protein